MVVKCGLDASGPGYGTVVGALLWTR